MFKIVPVLAVSALALLATACRTPQSATAKGPEYTIRVIRTGVAEAVLNGWTSNSCALVGLNNRHSFTNEDSNPSSFVANRIGETNFPHIRTFSSVITEPKLTMCWEQISRSKRSITYPPIKLHRGETKEVGYQKKIKYATEYDAKGRPLAYQTSGLGPRIKVYLAKASDDGTLDVDIDFEDVKLLEWQRFQFGKLPILETHGFTSRVTMHCNECVILGGVIREVEGKDGLKEPSLGAFLIQASKSDEAGSTVK